MFLVLQNRQSIEEWFHRNMGADTIIALFESEITDNSSVNVMIVSSYSQNNIHILLRKPNGRFSFIISNDRNRVIEEMLNISNVYSFPNIDNVINQVNEILIYKESVIPNDSITYNLSLYPVYRN